MTRNILFPAAAAAIFFLMAGVSTAEDLESGSPGQARAAERLYLLAQAESGEENSEEDPKEDGPMARVDWIKPSGFYSRIFKDYSADGDEPTFVSKNSLQFFNSNFEQRFNLNLTGKYPDKESISLNGRFLDEPYQDATYNVGLTGPNWIANFGDFTSDFPSGKLAKFSKNIRGVDVSRNFSDWGFTAMASEPKSKKESESFKGQNHRGPYRLKSGSIMRDSVTVKIDGAVMSKNLYAVDYFQGLINFTDSVDSTRIVEVTYETELLVALNTGSLRGFSVYYNQPAAKWRGMASIVSEGSNRDPDEVVVSGQKTYTLSAGDLDVPLTLGADARRLLTDQQVQAFVDVADPGTDIELDEDADFTLDRLNGTITFSSSGCAACTVGAQAVVRFSYYNSRFVRSQIDEPLTGDGRTEFRLSRETIYPGSEVVYLYVGSARQGAPLEPGTDYDVYPSRNSIVLLNVANSPDSLAGRSLVIDYEYIQRKGADATDATRSVFDALLSGTLADNWTMDLEYAQSDSDISKKPITVIEEYVGTVAAPTKEFELKHLATVGTVEIFFDDTLRDEAKKRENTDFRVEPDSTGTKSKIIFNSDVPAGTTLIANYQFLPAAAPGETQSGSALRVASNYSNSRLSLGGEWTNKDQQYNPMNDYDNFDTQNIKADATFKASSRLSLFANLYRYDRAQDLVGTDEDSFAEWRGGFFYADPMFPKAGYTRTTYTAEDNLAVSARDNERITDTFEVSWSPTRGRRDLVFSALVENSDFTDNLGRLSDQNRDKARYEVAASHKRLAMKAFFENSEVGTTAPAGFGANSSFVATTKTSSLDVGYSFGRIWALNGKMLVQDRADSRPSVNVANLDTVDLQLSAAAFKHVKSFQLGFNRNDQPNITKGGGTRSDLLNASLSYALTRWFVLQPSLSINQSIQFGLSETEQRNASIRLVYNEKKDDAYSASLSFQDGSRKTRDATKSDRAGNDILELTMNYQPTAMLGFAGRYRADRNDAPGSADSDLYGLETTYLLGRLTTRFNATRESKDKPTGEERRNDYIFSLESPVLKDFDFSLRYNIQKFQDAANPATAYDGVVLTSEIRYNF